MFDGISIFFVQSFGIIVVIRLLKETFSYGASEIKDFYFYSFFIVLAASIIAILVKILFENTYIAFFIASIVSFYADDFIS